MHKWGNFRITWTWRCFFSKHFSATVVAELVGFPDKQSQQLVCLLWLTNKLTTWRLSEPEWHPVQLITRLFQVWDFYHNHFHVKVLQWCHIGLHDVTQKVPGCPLSSKYTSPFTFNPVFRCFRLKNTRPKFQMDNKLYHSKTHQTLLFTQNKAIVQIHTLRK